MTETKSSIHKIIDDLLDGRKELARRSLQEFSDIDPASLKTLMEAWPRIQPDRKRFLLEELYSLAGDDTLVSFDDFARSMLADPDSQVRAGAIRLLDECEDVKLIPAFIKILTNDDSAETRAEASSSLGKFVQLGELEEISRKAQRQVEDALLAKVNSDDQLLVRRNALEALGYSSRTEVATVIESAYHRENPDWQASALFAMGRSADERWEDHVLSSLLDEIDIIRLAAVKAAGELGLESAQPVLFRLLEEEEDDDIAAAAVWSLSQIGGEDVRIYIQNLIDQSEDDEQVEFFEEALENLFFTEDLAKFDLLNLNADNEILDDIEEDEDE
ncbi:MAG: HEAT repeat domain-containing protein [Chloroflexi bacterium]|nr:HEAT repeat domain-containing protein [Chloroflexota bacterium]MBI1855724.1 HEAT repeat domain-containing protein [Chloroflexota bacterium]MBI3340209.1 HEAT repeat domain-containing protein [Chloroflexota bacterium]